VVYLAGGQCANEECQASFNVQMFSLEAKSWCTGKPMSFNGSNHATVAYKGKGYVISGFGGHNSTDYKKYFPDVSVFDPEANSYSEVAQVNTGRQNAVAVTVDDVIYLTGGVGKGPNRESVVLSSTEIFDGQIWNKGPDMHVPRAAHAVVSVLGRIWVIGGQGLNSTEFLDLKAHGAAKWTLGPEMSVARGYLGAEVVNNTIYACGGELLDASCEMLVLNADGSPNGNWTPVASMQDARYWFSLINYGDRLYAVNGYLDSAATKPSMTVERYSPGLDQWKVFYTGQNVHVCLGCQATLIEVAESAITCEQASS